MLIRCTPQPIKTIALAVLLMSAPVAADIVIDSLRDLDLGVVPPTIGRLTASADICVAMDARGRYQIVATGDGPASSFAIHNGASNISYQVFFGDRPGRRGQTLASGVPLGGLIATKRRNKRNCNRASANIEVEVSAAALRSAPAGIYRGTLTITVVPE